MKKLLFACVVAGIVTAACSDRSPSGQATGIVSPPDASRASQLAPERYIVVYNSSVSDTRAEIANEVSANEAHVEFVYEHAFRGWAGQLSPNELARLQRHPHVAFIEPDAVMSVDAVQTPTPSWGLDRIDQRNLPLSNSYTYPSTGAGVRFYSIDTGILYSHVDFGGRATPGFDASLSPNGAIDCHGHGTHTTSTAAGTTYGVAKAMTIIGVRVLDCTGYGTSATVAAGVDWVTANAIKPAVVNMSVGGPPSLVLDQAIANSVATGIVYVVSAGNNNQDACLESPSRAPSAITVGATTNTDVRSSFSNFGTCLDIFAPGSAITAAWGSSATATATINGTSMAAPHVAGTAGLYLSANPTATPAQVTNAITTNATANIVGSAGTGSPNRLLYMGFLNASGNQPPTASFTANCVGQNSPLQCAFDASASTDDVGIVKYTWNWGNGRPIENGTSPTTKNTFLVAGTYTVTLTVTDGGGLTATTTRIVTVPVGTTNQPPTATITSPTNNTVSILGASVSFAGAGNDPESGALSGASLVWTSNRDGQIGTGTSFSKSNLSAGAHTITLTATDAQGGTGASSVTITVNQPPTPTMTSPANNATFTLGTSVSFAGSANDPETGALSGTALVWTSSRDGQIGTGTSFSKSNLTVGTHTITLTATDPLGASMATSRTISIGNNQPPTAQITSPTNGATFLLGATVTFTGSATDPETGALSGAALAWTSSRDGAIGSGVSFTKSNLSAGAHTITLTATDPLGAKVTSSVSIVINQPPTAAISSPANGASFVQGTVVTFSGSGNDPETGALSGASLVWVSSRDGQIGTGTSFAKTNLTVGSHTITLTVTDALGATASATRSITINANQAPTAQISSPSNGAVFLAGTTVSFSGSSNDPETGALTGASLSWVSSRDGVIGSGTSFTKSNLTAGTHTITLTGTDPLGATGSASITIVINQPPTASITAPANNASFVQGTSVSFSGSGTDPEAGALSGAALVWTSSRDGQIGTGTAFSKTNLTVGTHTITLTATDPNGATGTTTRTITITAPPTGNQPPVADFTAVCGTAQSSKQCYFIASGSTDDVGIVTYKWNFGNGVLQTWTVPTGKYTYPAAGTYNVTLTVTDGGGLSSSITKSVTVR